MFVLVRLLKFFLGHIVYYNNVIDQHTENNYKKCLTTLFCASGKHIIRAVICLTVYWVNSWGVFPLSYSEKCCSNCYILFYLDFVDLWRLLLHTAPCLYSIRNKWIYQVITLIAGWVGKRTCSVCVYFEWFSNRCTHRDISKKFYRRSLRSS